MQEDNLRAPRNSYVSGLYALRSTVIWINTVGRTILDWMSGWLNSQLDWEVRSSWLNAASSGNFFTDVSRQLIGPFLRGTTR